MSLDRPALALGSGPGGVHDARRWVVEAFRELGRDDLVECTELAVSELVTNAVLHGAAPIEVRVRGTVDHPRVEVRDSSTEPPVMPETAPAPAYDLDSLDDDLDLDDLEGALLTFGRGLSIVARASEAWGADIDDTGKVVWFTPRADFSDDEGATGVITGLSEGSSRVELIDPVDVTVVGVPLRLYVGFQHHFQELRREVRLLALAHEADYPLAKHLSDLFGALERQLRDGLGFSQIDEAVASGAEVADLQVRMPRAAATTLQRFIELLDLADQFCREERMLSLARTPEQRDFQTWFLGEYVRQAAGATPTPWGAELSPHQAAR